MNVEIGAEVALFPEKEYISGIFVAVQEFATLFFWCRGKDRVYQWTAKIASRNNFTL
jgi:hypothetical protein